MPRFRLPATRLRERWPVVLFVAALLGVGFAGGVLVTRLQVFPTSLIDDAVGDYKDLRAHWRNDFGIEPTRYLMPARHPGGGVTRHQPAKMQPGMTMVSSLFDGQVGVRLLAADGTVVHQWPISYQAIWGDHDVEKGEPVTDWNVFAHGAMLLPGGDLVFTLDVHGSLVRLDACGEVVWKLESGFHHAVFQADDGTFWVPDGERIAHISSDGELLQEISLEEIVNQHGEEGIYFVRDGRTEEPHPNDVEILSEELAPAFPGFAAGDVLYSLRDINLVLVFDPVTGVIKWFQHGPWLRQHDPDFLPDGTISVFNNRRFRRASNIVTIDPATGRVRVVYRGTDDDEFYTDVGGKHQHLPNGNILITSFSEGRAFEVTPEGETVWEFINRFDEDRVIVVAEAVRYDQGTLDLASWPTCPAEDGAREVR